MSLLDEATDAVLVFGEEAGVDGDGNPTRVPSSAPVTVRGRVQPANAEETTAKGYGVGTYYRFIGRSFPDGAWSRVEWDGRDWDVDGEPLWSRGSEATRHVTVMLKARGPRSAT